jgi:DnaJ domain
MTSLDHHYQVLEIKPGASLTDINQAYKDLVFIWHPDRIPQDNERLHQKALQKLQAAPIHRLGPRLVAAIPPHGQAQAVAAAAAAMLPLGQRPAAAHRLRHPSRHPLAMAIVRPPKPNARKPIKDPLRRI